MSSKILMPQLVSMLAASTGTPKKQAETFLKAYFSVITESLQAHESVRIKDFGTFKISRVEARKSVDVSSGAEVRIPPHFKVVFTPAKHMADKVNKEFAWLDIVEIPDEVSNNELENVDGDVYNESPSALISSETENKPQLEQETVPESESISESESATISIASVEPTHPVSLTREQREQSEKLGEELEEDFGNIEPVEPFGPIDPDDPEPGTPIPEESASPIIETEYHSVVPSSLPPDFDPYAVDASLADSPEEVGNPGLPTPEAPYYITKDEVDNLATKTEFKLLGRNIKKLKAGMKSSVEKLAEENRRQNRRTLIWSLVCCVILMIGGFFITYWLITDRLTTKEQIAINELETEVKDEVEDEEYALATLTKVNVQPQENTTEDISEGAQTEPAKHQHEVTTSTAPTTPSDIKAMDKVTNTRYLTTMAKEYYGNYNLWPYIYLENEGKLGHPDRIKPGTPVVIPNIEKYNIDPANPKDIEKARKLGVEIYKKYAMN